MNATCKVRFWMLTVLLTSQASLAADQSAVGTLLAKTGISKGICSVPECNGAELALGIARQSQFLVHAFDEDRPLITAAVEVCCEAGYDRNRLVFECLPSEPLPYADHFVDLLVIGKSDSSVSVSEMARVVRPRGWVLSRGETERISALRQSGFDQMAEADGWYLWRKGEVVGSDDWSHWYHEPDNNPISTDTAIKAPYLTQWLGVPYYHAMPVISTVAAGRVFVASGHIAHHDREIPTLNTLVARNGYNGTVLWQRPLPEGYLVHRSAFIATADVFYLIDGQQVLCLDPETGGELERLRMPGVKGALVWIAKVGDTLYALAGEHEPPAETLQVHSDGRGWGWDQVDRNYSPGGEHQIRWGFGESLVAYDLQASRSIWRHEQPGMDSRAMGILGDKLFHYVPGQKLTCLDRRSGEVVWTNEDPEHLALLELEAQGLQGTPGFRTSSMLLATPVGLFMQGQKRLNVLGFSIEDGRFLWSKRKFHNNPNMVYVNGQLLISGVQRDGAVQVIDPATGDTLESLNFWKGSCARMTGSPEALYCRGEGLGRYDFETRIYTAERTARPGCNDGAIPANGLLYVGPWLCDCNLSLLGHLALGPAHDFDAHRQSVTDRQLQRGETTEVADAVTVQATDWPEYRGNQRRTAATAATIPHQVQVLWRCEPATPGALPAQPVAVGERVFAAGDDGIVRCIDGKSGESVWQFVTGGPVLASPTVWEGRLFVGSGDGYVYCLDAGRGVLLWRFRVAPVERRIMVYGRLASTWPVNSGVVVNDGVAFAAAGIMFRDGTHVVALDARTGQLRWHNGITGLPINDRFELQAASARHARDWQGPSLAGFRQRCRTGLFRLEDGRVAGQAGQPGPRVERGHGADPRACRQGYHGVC